MEGPTRTFFSRDTLITLLTDDDGRQQGSENAESGRLGAPAVMLWGPDLRLDSVSRSDAEGGGMLGGVRRGRGGI